MPLRACGRRGGGRSAQARTPQHQATSLTSADECCTDDATRMTPASVQPAYEVVAATASRDATVKAAVVSTCTAPPEHPNEA